MRSGGRGIRAAVSRRRGVHEPSPGRRLMPGTHASRPPVYTSPSGDGGATRFASSCARIVVADAGGVRGGGVHFASSCVWIVVGRRRWRSFRVFVCGSRRRRRRRHSFRVFVCADCRHTAGRVRSSRQRVRRPSKLRRQELTLTGCALLSSPWRRQERTVAQCVLLPSAALRGLARGGCRRDDSGQGCRSLGEWCGSGAGQGCRSLGERCGSGAGQGCRPWVSGAGQALVRAWAGGRRAARTHG
jgi:hypothetical protein